jgi:hypothetical protein
VGAGGAVAARYLSIEPASRANSGRHWMLSLAYTNRR